MIFADVKMVRLRKHDKADNLEEYLIGLTKISSKECCSWKRA